MQHLTSFEHSRSGEGEAERGRLQQIKKAVSEEVTASLLASAASAEGWVTIFSHGYEQVDYPLQIEVPASETLERVKGSRDRCQMV